jgi:hypothetical protein
MTENFAERFIHHRHVSLARGQPTFDFVVRQNFHRGCLTFRDFQKVATTDPTQDSDFSTATM